jgi:hypothetical protein
MANEKLEKAINSFVLERMNDVGMDQPEELGRAFADFEKAATALKERLPSELTPLFRECENAFSIFDAAVQETFYRAGFADALEILRMRREK